MSENETPKWLTPPTRADLERAFARIKFDDTTLRQAAEDAGMDYETWKAGHS